MKLSRLALWPSISKWHSSIGDKTISTVSFHTNETFFASLAPDTLNVPTSDKISRMVMLLCYSKCMVYSPMSLSMREDLMPDLPVHGYTSGQGWHVLIYLTPDLCHKLHTLGLLHFFGRSWNKINILVTYLIDTHTLF